MDPEDEEELLRMVEDLGQTVELEDGTFKSHFHYCDFSQAPYAYLYSIPICFYLFLLFPGGVVFSKGESCFGTISTRPPY